MGSMVHEVLEKLYRDMRFSMTNSIDDLVDSEQVIDFSSTYLESSKAELAEFGYSRDKRPDKLQINFGMSTGINEIPTAKTIQRGNVQDKKHIREILRSESPAVSRFIPGHYFIAI